MGTLDSLLQLILNYHGPHIRITLELSLAEYDIVVGGGVVNLHVEALIGFGSFV